MTDREPTPEALELARQLYISATVCAKDYFISGLAEQLDRFAEQKVAAAHEAIEMFLDEVRRGDFFRPGYSRLAEVFNAIAAMRVAVERGSRGQHEQE